MHAGKRLDACRLCYQDEENGIRSYRQWANEYWLGASGSAEAVARSVERSQSAGFEAARPLSFDLRLGNLCNLKCRMCSAGFSSQIEKDEVHSAWRPHDTPGRLEHRFETNVPEWSESPQLLDEL